MPIDCRTCAACCFSDSETYVPVNDADRERLGKQAIRLVRREGRDQYMKMNGCSCIALAVRGAGFACTVYDRRPEICREFERGSSTCLEEHRLKKDRARRALRG